MSDIALQVENLCKQYTIGTAHCRHDTLRDQLMDGLCSLFRRNGRSRGPTTIAALNGISFEVRRGEIFGIVGKNGAGKSTLLKILSRITEPTSGQARVFGRVGSLLEVGTGFHPELTGRENIYLNGAILGMHTWEIDEKFDEILAFAEITKFIDTPVKRYSSGMYVRLAFSIAAHLRPVILLLDEVLAVGDLSFQRKCFDHARELQRSNATVLLVSHNMFAIKSICSRAIYIAEGRVKIDGSPEEVIQAYEADSRLTSPMRGSRRSVDATESPADLITHIEVLDEAGRPRLVFDYGERMRVRFRYDIPQPLSSPNFVIAFIRSDNVACCNYVTTLDGLAIPSLVGRGVLEVLTPPLKLVAEMYVIHVLVWDSKFHRLFSYQIGTSFHVRHDLYNSTHFGVFHDSGIWSWQPDNTGMLSENVCPREGHP
jgi:lipopolysaccharide transport system ATP-binding protein